MKYLNRKLYRDVINNWTQFFSVFLMAFLSVLIFVGLQGSWRGLEVSLTEYIESSNLPDSWLQSTGFTKDDISQIKAISGIEDVNEKIRLQVVMSCEDEQKKYIILDTIDNTQMNYSIVEGDNVTKDNKGIWLNEEFATENNVAVGDYIDIKYGSLEESVKVLGTVKSADRIYFTGTLEFLAPNYANYGYGYISEKMLKDIFQYESLPNIVEIYGENTELRETAENILENKLVAYYDRSTLTDVSEALDRVTQIKNLSFMFSFVFILLAVLAMYTTIRRLIETQTKEIAVLKAIGFSNKKIGMHYAAYGFLVGGFGTILGVGVSPLLSLFVLWTQKSMFSIPKWRISYSVSSAVVAALVICVCVISALLASKDAIQGLPVLFLRGTGQKKGRRFWGENLKRFWRKIKIENRWAIRDSASNSVRLIMGIVGVVGGMMLLIVGFGTPSSIKHLVKKAYTEDFSYSKRIDVVDYEEAKDSYNGQWVQISQARFSPDDGYNRLLIIISEGNFVNMKTSDGFSVENDGAYVTQGFADRAGLKVGDELKVYPAMYENEFVFAIAGIITTETNQGVYITQDAWENAGGKFLPKTILVSEEVSEEDIASDSNVISIIEIEDQKENAYKFVDSLMSVFIMIIVFAVLLVIVVLYNLGSLNFVERERDYATLRVLGFYKKELRNITMTENILTTFVGWILGVPLGIWFLDLYVSTFSTIRLEYTSYVNASTLIIASLVVWCASMSTTLFVSHRIKKLEMVEALKGVE